MIRERPRLADFDLESRPCLKGVKAVYFDLDDTLCAYWEASKFALFRAFELAGPEGFSPQEMIQIWASAFRKFGPDIKSGPWYEVYLKSGEPTRTEQMRLALLEVGISSHELAHKLGQIYANERNRALTLFSDAIEVLTKLSEHFPLGLITNGPADVQRQEVETLGIEKFFKNIFIEGEMGEGKPNEEVFARAARAVQAEPKELLFVGNSYHHDVYPALKYGWHAIWVRRSSDVPPSAPGPESVPQDSPAPDAAIGELLPLLDILGVS